MSSLLTGFIFGRFSAYSDGDTLTVFFFKCIWIFPKNPEVIRNILNSLSQYSLGFEDKVLFQTSFNAKCNKFLTFQEILSFKFDKNDFWMMLLEFLGKFASLNQPNLVWSKCPIFSRPWVFSKCPKCSLASLRRLIIMRR